MRDGLWVLDDANGSGVLLHIPGIYGILSRPLWSVPTGSLMAFISLQPGRDGQWKAKCKAQRNLLHYTGGKWSAVAPPPVSPDWRLSGVHFTSPNEGWAVGADKASGIGVLFHYSGNSWSFAISSYDGIYWLLNSVHFTSPGEGWAVGSAGNPGDGLLLHYTGGKWSSVAPPSVSSYWGLTNVHFAAPGEGWFVGFDGVHNKGVLIH